MYEYDLRSGEPAYHANPSHQRDEELLQALVTAGAMVALADGVLAQAESDELVNFIDRQGFVPSIFPRRIAAAFDAKVRVLDDRNGPNAILEAFRPLAGLSLASVVMRVAQRVASADGKLHPRELQTIDLIRLILTQNSKSRRRGECRLLPPIVAASRIESFV